MYKYNEVENIHISSVFAKLVRVVWTIADCGFDIPVVLADTNITE